MVTSGLSEQEVSGQPDEGPRMFRQDKIWSRHSNDKVDIAATLARVIRSLHCGLPLEQPLSALSIGSSNEPQFRILESMCKGGLNLLDIERDALDVVAERIARQKTSHVNLIEGDYRLLFSTPALTRSFRHTRLRNSRVQLMTLHHSMYYCLRSTWRGLMTNLYHEILDDAGSEGTHGPYAVIHAVLMDSQATDRQTTTWLYNHYAGRFFGAHNDQDLLQFAEEMQADSAFSDATIRTRTSRVEFFLDDFEQFMSVIWMILLHPHVHEFTKAQQREVTEYVHEQFFRPRRPLVQMQDHLVIYRGTKDERLCLI